MRRIVFFALLIILVVLATVGYSNKDRVWSVSGHSALQLAKTKWKDGQRQEAMELWFYGIQRTINDSLNREKAYTLMRQSDEFLEEGKLTDALAACHEAEKIYNEEGEMTYHCLLIEQRISEITTPVP